ncbi:MAG: SPL family radical SAM protein [Bacteroidota bacterium]
MREIEVKSVLNKKKKRDSWFLDEYTLNPYEGCSFNCQYCYIRGSKYGENMADSLSVKINAAEVLDRQLAFRVKKSQYGIIALASATDPYIRAEEKYRMTENLLKLILKHRFPVLMITKSELIVRDLDILKEIDRQGIHAPDLGSKLDRGVIISFSFSTLDPAIASTLEPGAPLPQARLRTMQKCKEAGFLVGVNYIPSLPFISDTDEKIEHMARAAKDHGADYILIGGLTLFGNQPADSKTLYYKFLERTHPHLIPEYKKLYRIFFMPPKSYKEDLDRRATVICNHVGIRRTILDA